MTATTLPSASDARLPTSGLGLALGLGLGLGLELGMGSGLGLGLGLGLGHLLDEVRVLGGLDVE